MPNIPRAITAGDACGWNLVKKSICSDVSVPPNELCLVERWAEPLRYLFHDKAADRMVAQLTAMGLVYRLYRESGLQMDTRKRRKLAGA